MTETTTTTGTTTTTTTITITITTEAPAETTTTEAPATGAIAPTIGTLPAPAEVAPTPVETPTDTTAQEMTAAHESAVKFCVELEAEEFAEHIRYAQHFGNKFPRYVKELRDVVNADDVYKDAVVRICSPLGEEVIRKAIKLVDSKKILDLSEYLKYVKIIVEEWGEV